MRQFISALGHFMTFEDYVAELKDTPPHIMRQLIERYANECGIGKPLAAMHLTSEERLCATAAALCKQAEADLSLERHPEVACIFPIIDRLEKHQDIPRMAGELREAFAFERTFDHMAQLTPPGNG